MTVPRVDQAELRDRVKDVYRQVAEHPEGGFHFSVGRALAESLGYPKASLDQVPARAVESFAGVGYHFDLAAIMPGERVLDLGSGSGLDSFIAGTLTGPTGRVTGLDMTESQLAKADDLRQRHGVEHVVFRQGFIEELPFEDREFDVVISNGVINLSATKQRVFAEIARVLRPGGRLALSDIVTETPLSEDIVCQSSLWAACIGGAEQEGRYLDMMRDAGLQVATVRENPQYEFLSGSAVAASAKFGVKSVSLLAERRERARSA